MAETFTEELRWGRFACGIGDDAVTGKKRRLIQIDISGIVYALSSTSAVLTSGAGAIPTVDLTMGVDIFEGYFLHIQRNATGSGSYGAPTLDILHQITPAEHGSGTIPAANFSADGYINPTGNYWQQYRWEDDSGGYGPWSEVSGTVTVTTTTLDPANRNTNNAQLSGGNLVVIGVNQGASQCVRTTVQVPNPGKYYFEVTITNLAASGHVQLGCSDGTFVFATTFSTPAFDGKGAGLHSNDNSYPSVTHDAIAQATGGILQCVIKRTGANTVKVWIGHNNTWLGDPSAETGGETVTLTDSNCYGYVGVNRVDTATCNFGATAFTYAIPTGATVWS